MSIQTPPPTQGHIPDTSSPVWFGMRCGFTRAALEGALASDDAARPMLIVLPNAPRPRATGWPESPFDRWLRTQGIAVVEVADDRHPDWRPIVEEIGLARASLGVMACFPHKIPRRVRQAFPHGMLNIHPSLLPRLRGPEPVFHAYRLGLDVTGVSIHLVDDGWDTGPVLRQVAVPIPDAGDARSFEASLARIGGELIPETISQLLAGRMLPEPQDDTQACWAPFTSDRDRIIPATLTVRRALRMVRAVGDAFGPLAVLDASTGEVIPIAGIASEMPEHSLASSPPARLVEATFADGIARFRRARGQNG